MHTRKTTTFFFFNVLPRCRTFKCTLGIGGLIKKEPVKPLQTMILYSPNHQSTEGSTHFQSALPNLTVPTPEQLSDTEVEVHGQLLRPSARAPGARVQNTIATIYAILETGLGVPATS